MLVWEAGISLSYRSYDNHKMGRDAGDAIEKVWSHMRQVTLRKLTRRENLDNIGWLQGRQKKIICKWNVPFKLLIFTSESM